MLNTQRIAWLVALAGMTSTSMFASTVIFSDFELGNLYNSDYGWLVSGSSYSSGYEAVAMPFPSTGNFNLAQIDVAISYIPSDPSGNPPEPFVLDLDSDNAGTPGRVLMSWTISSGIPRYASCCSVETVTPTSTVSLLAGTQYWLTVSPSDPTASMADVWHLAYNYSVHDGNVRFQHSPGGPYTLEYPPNQPLGAFDVLGNSPVPEPASAWMMAGALGLLGTLWRWRKQRSNQV